jgi:hypothetical protein
MKFSEETARFLGNFDLYVFNLLVDECVVPLSELPIDIDNYCSFICRSID